MSEQTKFEKTTNASDSTAEALVRFSNLLIALDSNMQQIKLALVQITELLDEQSKAKRRQ